MWPAGNEVRRDTGKRDGEIVEALELGIRKGNPVKDQRYLLTCIEASRKLQPFAQAEFQTIRDFMSILFAPELEVVERCLAPQYIVPIDPVGDLPDLRGRPSCRIDPSD